MKDQLIRTIDFKTVPTRIVSLVPSQTELLYDLDLENSIVGITKFCVHPPQLKKNKTIVGGTKKINIDKIIDLQPDIILCNKEENTEEIVLACQEICSVHVSDIVTIQDCLELIVQYGVIFKKKNEASKISDRIVVQLNQFNSFVQNKKSLKVAYFIWKDPWMVAGNNTFINHVLERNNFQNVFSKFDRYPEISVYDLPDDLDLILLSSEPFPFKQMHRKELQTYSNSAKLYLVDGEMFSWYGSRLIKAFDYFKKLHHKIQLD